MNARSPPRHLDLRCEVRARARVIRQTLDALTADTHVDVMSVLAVAAHWDGAATPLELAAATRGVERLYADLDGEEYVAMQAVRSILALAHLAMRSEGNVTEPLLVAPLDTAVRALVAAGWAPGDADWQVYAWLAEALFQQSEPPGNDAPADD